MMYPWAMMMLGFFIGAALMKWHEERKAQELRQITAELLEAMEEFIPVMTRKTQLLAKRGWEVLWK